MGRGRWKMTISEVAHRCRLPLVRLRVTCRIPVGQERRQTMHIMYIMYIMYPVIYLRIYEWWWDIPLRSTGSAGASPLWSVRVAPEARRLKLHPLQTASKGGSRCNDLGATRFSSRDVPGCWFCAKQIGSSTSHLAKLYTQCCRLTLWKLGDESRQIQGLGLSGEGLEVPYPPWHWAVTLW